MFDVHIHPRELGPHLHRSAENHTLQDFIACQDAKGGLGILSFKAEGFVNFLILSKHPCRCDVASTVQIGKNADRLFPAISTCQPAGGVWQEKHADKKNHGWEDLHAPWNAKCGRALVWVGRASSGERCSVLDEELDQNSPRDRPLLQRYYATTDLFGRNLSLVDRNHCGCESHP